MLAHQPFAYFPQLSPLAFNAADPAAILERGNNPTAPSSATNGEEAAQLLGLDDFLIEHHDPVEP
jgi:hypothetical protein